MKRYTTPLHRFLARRSAARKAARQAALCRRIDRQFTLCETDGTVGICCGTLMVHCFAETDTVGHVCLRTALGHTPGPESVLHRPRSVPPGLDAHPVLHN